MRADKEQEEARAAVAARELGVTLKRLDMLRDRVAWLLAERRKAMGY